MSTDLTCLICDSNLRILNTSDKEYFRAKKTQHGTMKWFICTDSQCACVFIRDKQSGSWSLSPDTYSKLLHQGYIDNILE